ncbi:MAG: MDR family MFS transporter [Anaerolineaceae bacterium]|jgi:MFS family permease
MARVTQQEFPTKFWLMLAGVLISSLGMTLVWPFLLIYASKTLALPMASVTSLMTINSITGLISSILVGTLVDRFGRKGIMVAGLIGSALVYLGYIGANTYLHFSILMGASGVFGPLTRVAASAMIADMFEGDKRTQAFALFRTAGNLGFGSGPILGGMIMSTSYRIGMISAAAALGIYGLITVIFLSETLPPEARKTESSILQNFRGFGQALKDKVFVRLLLSFTLMDICARLIWVVLAVYAKTNFDVPETQYGFIPTTNGLMVVLFQVFVTRVTRKYPESKVMTFGAVFYPLAMLTVALSNGFIGFWLAMVIMTIGELITAPTATMLVASIAPPEMRGRYLGLFGLTFYVALAIGPLGAGILSDHVGMRAPWWGGVLVGILAVFSYYQLQRYLDRRAAEAKLTPNPAE